MQANNKVEKEWAPEGFQKEKKDCLSHHEVLYRLDGYDPDRGVKIVGHRGYCLTGYGLFLNLALVNYGLEYLFSKGFTPNQPPFFMNREAMAKTAQLSQFDEELYKVTDDGTEKTDKYLIATSEQPLSALHESEWLTEKDVPIKYAGYSTCFRKEAGSHGRDAWGLFRVHQFEKIEQFIFCKPDDSWGHLEEMLANSEGFYQSLGLSYRVVAIVSGALNNAAAKKFDLESWFPFQSEYKELVSCSNCTDYQTRELEIRYGAKSQTSSKKTYAHALVSLLPKHCSRRFLTSYPERNALRYRAYSLLRARKLPNRKRHHRTRGPAQIHSRATRVPALHERTPERLDLSPRSKAIEHERPASKVKHLQVAQEDRQSKRIDSTANAGPATARSICWELSG